MYDATQMVKKIINILFFDFLVKKSPHIATSQKISKKEKSPEVNTFSFFKKSMVNFLVAAI